MGPARAGTCDEGWSAAVAYGQEVSLGRLQSSKRKKSKGSFTDVYLSRWHRDNPGDGCTMAALAQGGGSLDP